MAQKNWRKVQQIFHAVREASGPTGPLLDSLCSGDEGLRRQVEELLSADVEAGRFLEPRTVAKDLGSGDALLPGATVGPYRILTELGRGGMSSVYLAERVHADYARGVALKLVRSGVERESSLRFLDECRILASFNHPNIAAFLDTGTTGDGRPYIVMELIEGTPIDTYCDENALSIDERLVLFRDLCTAVHYAHRHLIVHRDIKPSNVLVTAEGVLKLLDFGIAKPLDSDLLDRERELTHAGAQPMTPRYCSPEQVRGEPITVSTDIYLLGLLLYKLLVGKLPPHHPALGESSAETPRPSAVVKTGDTSATGRGGPANGDIQQLARAKATSRLRRKLEGDLDQMVLMAMREEPERRYESAEQFADDVNRHLNALPVRARDESVGYRLRKFLFRNRVLVGATTTFVLMVLGFGVAMAWQANRIAEARDRAEKEQAKAEQVSTLLFDLFGATDPVVAKGELVTAKDLLERGTARVQAELHQQPEIQATALATIGRVYQELGLHRRAEPLLEEALDLRKVTLGKWHPDTASSLAALGRARSELGEYEKAQALFEEALKVRRAISVGPTREEAESLHDLGVVHWRRGDYEPAVSFLREALVRQRQLLDEAHPRVASSLNQLGVVLNERGEHLEAERAHREALAIRRSVLETDHPDIAESESNLAYVLGILGRVQESERLFEESLELRTKVYGAAHPATANTQHSWAIILMRTGRPAEAENLFRSALATRRKLFGTTHPAHAATLSALAEALHQQEKLVEAARLYEESIALGTRMVGPAHPAIAFPMTAYGRLLVQQGKLNQAERILRQALQLRQEGLPPGSPLTAEVKGILGDCLLARGQVSEAEELLLASHDVLGEMTPPLEPELGAVRRALVELYEKTNRSTEASEYRALLDGPPTAPAGASSVFPSEAATDRTDP